MSTILSLLLTDTMYLAAWIAGPLLASVAVSSDAETIVNQQPVQSLSEDGVFNPSFDSFVEDTLREWHVPGLSIAVVDNGNIVSKVLTP